MVDNTAVLNNLALIIDGCKAGCPLAAIRSREPVIASTLTDDNSLDLSVVRQMLQTLRERTGTVPAKSSMSDFDEQLRFIINGISEGYNMTYMGRTLIRIYSTKDMRVGLYIQNLHEELALLVSITEQA